jgi:hypothetical protein
VEVLTDMQNTGETAAFMAMCPDSGSCQQLVRLVDSYYEAGGWLKTKPWTVVGVEKVGQSGATLQLNAEIRSSATEYKKSSSSPVERFEGGLTHNQLFLRRLNGDWVIQEWTQTT